MLPIGGADCGVVGPGDGRNALSLFSPLEIDNRVESPLGQFHRARFADLFLKPALAVCADAGMSRKQIGTPEQLPCCLHRDGSLPAHGRNAPENISLASIILKIGFTTTTRRGLVADLTHSLGGVSVPPFSPGK